MSSMNPKVDLYLIDGCGRCKYYATPDCKVRTWVDELELLRSIALDTELVEDLKWSVPVYTYHNANVINISAFKDYACVGFFKGALLRDTEQLLTKHGESSQSVRTLKFINKKSILELQPIIKAYISEAIELEKKGEKVVFVKNLEPIPDELAEKFIELPLLQKAFYELTPGRQRGYIIYFSQPKQSKTRFARIDSKMEDIMNGIGMHDRL